jgi:hypothetical protein
MAARLDNLEMQECDSDEDAEMAEGTATPRGADKRKDEGDRAGPSPARKKAANVAA